MQQCSRSGCGRQAAAWCQTCNESLCAFEFLNDSGTWINHVASTTEDWAVYAQKTGDTDVQTAIAVLKAEAGTYDESVKPTQFYRPSRLTAEALEERNRIAEELIWSTGRPQCARCVWDKMPRLVQSMCHVRAMSDEGFCRVRDERENARLRAIEVARLIAAHKPAWRSGLLGIPARKLLLADYETADDGQGDVRRYTQTSPSRTRIWLNADATMWNGRGSGREPGKDDLGYLLGKAKELGLI